MAFQFSSSDHSSSDNDFYGTGSANNLNLNGEDILNRIRSNFGVDDENFENNNPYDIDKNVFK